MATAEWFKRLVTPLADKIVYASGAYVGVKSTINGLGETLIDFDRAPTGLADERLHALARLIRPITSDSLRLVRVGGDHDGGYVMADDFDGVVGAISIGVGPDVTWDRAISDRGIRVAMFDPTVRRLPERVERGQFFRVGIGQASGSSTYRPLPELVTMANLPGHGDLLLKVDVEGAEWPSFERVEASHLQRCRQLAFEFHGLGALHDTASADRILTVLASLSAHHAPIHVHANNYDDLVRFDGNWFPNAIEVTYLRRDRLGDARPTEVIADALDRPCDPRVPEIPLEALARLP